MFTLTTKTAEVSVARPLKTVLKLSNGREVCANLDQAAAALTLGKGKRLWLFGAVYYHLVSPDEIKPLTTADSDYLTRLAANTSPADLVTTLEGDYIGLLADEQTQTVTVFSDRFARVDTFYTLQDGALHLATDLDFIFQHVQPAYDQTMLASLFTTYGWYCPKGHTIYANVQQLRVGQLLTFSAKGLDCEQIPFTPQETEDYGDAHLERYYRLLRESVLARIGAADKVWVSSSSGWDSSVLTGVLASELDSRRIGMVAGSMKYSSDTDVINQFEMDKIEAIGKFYGLTPEVVPLDFESSLAAEYWKGTLGWYKSRHCYAYASNNFARLADGLTGAVGGSATIFNGEASDSFHNFGFSQFGTFFHTAKSFTEYADKMNCYLYGPDFLRKCLDGSHAQDKVYLIFQKMLAGVEYDTGDGTRAGMIERFLFPFFYGSPRLPFARTELNPALTPAGQQAVFAFPYRTYMPEVLEGLTESNVYAWYVYLYMSFHTQGSTGGIHKHSMDRHGHAWRSPYIDSRLMDLLARAPQSWGRGLDLNNTKYPLKWVARNKIRFPYTLLDKGPHSYLYDVIEGFSLFAEITYRSGVTDLFKQTLAQRGYRDLLDDKTFNTPYLDRLVEGYLNGQEVRGPDFNVLVSLITLSVTGWY